MASERASQSSGASTPTHEPAMPPIAAHHGAHIAHQAKRQALHWFTLRRSTSSLEQMGVGEKKRGLVLVSQKHTPVFPVWRIVLVTVGGSINSSFLIAGGITIMFGGPGGALISYILSIIVLYTVMTSLMEVGSRMPASVPYYMYGTRVLGQTVGVALAWSYWLVWIALLVYEMVAGGFIIQFWLPSVDRAVWCLLLFLSCVTIVIVDSRLYSPIESTLTLFTIAALVAGIIVGSLTAAGKLGDHKRGFETWQTDDGPVLNGIVGVIGASIFANFSVQGAEAGAIMALKSPSRYSRRMTPIVICSVLAVLLLPSIFVTGLILSYSDPWFDKDTFDSADGSSLTYVFEAAKIMPAAHVINTILLISAILDCCVSLYIATTIIQDLADHKLAPSILQSPKDRDHALSPYSLGLCCMVGLGVWALTYIRETGGFVLLGGVIGISGVIMWSSVSIMHFVVRWSKRFRHKGDENEYRSWLFPVGPLVCLVFELGVLTGLFYILAWVGFDINIFLFETLGLFIFIALIIIAAVAQHFGYCQC
ncbi:hypothetical protein IWW43_001899 [Coemansia sp. RSA 1935]|nr:hypothetical protein IWW43_001899 [Coemansia sp. RSA 1935]